MRLRRLAAYTLLALVVALAAARLYGGPVALIVVAGRSMEPTMRFGDVALAVRGGFKPGDIVVWCTGPFSCVVHRLLEIRGETAITKGDANPVPDPPVPLRLVEYRVVAVIPRELVWTPIAVYLAYEAVTSFRRAPRELSLETVAVIVVGSYVAVTFTTPILAPTPGPESLNIGELIPRIDLVAVKVLRNGTVTLDYRYKEAAISSITFCTASTASLTMPCTAEIEGTRITVRIPTEIYRTAYMAGTTLINVRLEALLKPMGRLEAVYPIHVGWLKPALKLEGCNLTVYNPNPAPLELNVTIYMGRGSTVEKLVVGANETVNTRLPKGSWLVEVAYPKPGGKTSKWVKRVTGCG